MRLYADENYPEQTIFALRELGHDVLTAKEDKRHNQKIKDESVLTRANELNRAVLTEDRDYIELHKKDQNHKGIVFTTEAKNKDFDSVALGVHKEIKDKESLESELLRVNKANTEKEKAEIEKLREEHKQELEKAKEEHLKNKELEKEQKIKEKEELKQKEEQKIEKDQKEQSEKKQLEKEQLEKKQEENTVTQEEKKNTEKLFTSEELKVDLTSDNKLQITCASGRVIETDNYDKEKDKEFLKDLEDKTFRQEFVKQFEEAEVGQEVIIAKVTKVEEPPQQPPPTPTPEIKY